MLDLLSLESISVDKLCIVRVLVYVCITRSSSPPRSATRCYPNPTTIDPDITGLASSPCVQQVADDLDRPGVFVFKHRERQCFQFVGRASAAEKSVFAALQRPA
jgi:hypothetical protein